MVNYKEMYGEDYINKFKDSLWTIRNNITNTDDVEVQSALDHMQSWYAHLEKCRECSFYKK